MSNLDRLRGESGLQLLKLWSRCAVPCSRSSALVGILALSLDRNLFDLLSTAIPSSGIVRRKGNYRKGVADKWKQELQIAGGNVVHSHTL